MTLLIFIIVLALLVLVHEFGHFIVAKKGGIRVDEFGLGFPPKVWGYRPKGSETLYTLNAIPFGGFVKIFGENPDDESISGPDMARSFVHKSKWIQLAVLAAGVVFNILFAWVLFSLGFMIGMPTVVDDSVDVHGETRVLITSVSPDSPAAQGGFSAGDEIVFIESRGVGIQKEDLTVLGVQSAIAESGEEGIMLQVMRDGEPVGSALMPVDGVVEGKKAIGIALAEVGIVRMPVHTALYEGAVRTITMTRDVAVGLVGFIGQAFTGKADFGSVTGPVGIAGLVGDAARVGIVQLMAFTAFISVNLAVLNMLPFPALDGGRILFVIIEAIKGRPIKPVIANTVNTIGFALLLLLMLVVTYRDIVRLF